MVVAAGADGGLSAVEVVASPLLMAVAVVLVAAAGVDSSSVSSSASSVSSEFSWGTQARYIHRSAWLVP